MEAATVNGTFGAGSMGQHGNLRAELMHPYSLNRLCRFPTYLATSASFAVCRRQRSGEGWVSREPRASSKRKCQCSLTDTSFSSASGSSSRREVATAAAVGTKTATPTSSTSTTTTPTPTPTHSNTVHKDAPSPGASPAFTRRRQQDEVGVQELTVYEVNEGDRNSPVLLLTSKLAVDGYKRLHNLGGLGDLVPFTNKLFDGSLKKRLGITAGLISVIRYYPKENGFLYESVYSFYFGDFGHISVMGPYKTHEDTILTVTGGSGIFTGVYGTVQISNVEFPKVLFYRFKLYGIPQLPQALRWETVPPRKGVRPSRTASLPGFALPNFTD